MEQRVIAGRYALEEPLGEGSWRATDTELGREVVVRVGAEADVAAATLAHPNIARIFDQGEADGERFVVLEHLPGGSLAERGLLTEESARDVAAALAYAHGQGVGHGSLSAETIRFDEEGRAKVVDFGATGGPEDDVRAFGALLAEAGLEAAAAAALAGDLAGAAAALRPAAPTPVPDPEPATQILPPAAPARRRSPVLALVVLAALLAAGIGAALLATAGDSSSADERTGSLSVPVPTGSSSEETVAPPPAPATTEETTTEEKTTSGQTTTTAPPPPPPPTTAPPPPTTAPPPPTEEPPPPTEEPPPPTEATPPPTDPGG